MLPGSSVYIELLFLVLLSHSSSDVYGFTDADGYKSSSQSSETEETEVTDYSDDIIFPVINVSYDNMTANGTTVPYLPTATTTDEPNSTIRESTTTVLPNTTDHSHDSTIATETTSTTETATTRGMTTAGVTTTKETTAGVTTTEVTTAGVTTTEVITKEMETTAVMTTTDMITTVVPIPSVHKFSLKSGNSYCFLFQSDIMFQVFYNSHSKLVKSYKFTLSNATINDNESVCSEHYTKLSLTFIPYGRNEEHKWTLVLLFNRMEPNKTSNDATNVSSIYTLDSITLTYYMDKNLFPDSLTPETLCDSDVNVNNMVPIGVGIALIVCIVVAITVFIVFNKRNRRSYTTL
ncbi:hypothetical protein Smp_162770 [Schistosoma mansoni]|uniref:hypothetical protein n=1 Tax=Schistosoma mansoni TaxID=6183 RepID=UPI0001A62AAB|nr:hypothetical protein Smp_162770 [Schistosoma mansoni]|eukprot:XP_018655407.1 hypothetical protein Smp_162770 [Schistosoma mansoni]